MSAALATASMIPRRREKTSRALIFSAALLSAIVVPVPHLAGGSSAAEAGGPPSPAARIRLRLESGSPEEALALAEDALSAPASGVSPEDIRALEILRARCFFELGDYPSAERRLRELIDRLPAGSADWAECLAHLSQVLSFQRVDDEAIRTLERALEAGRDPRLHRLGIRIALRAHRYEEASRHAAAILSLDSGDAFARFARGICLARAGRLPEALPDLEQGLRVPGARRDAQFELALAKAKLRQPGEALLDLIEIVAEDPWDEEACYQLMRQLLQLKTAAAVRTGAQVARYLDVLKAAAGPSSRDHHYVAAGQAAPAAILRAVRWERLGSLERAVGEVRRATVLSRGDVNVRLAIADFWARVGLLAEAEASLGGVGADVTEASDAALETGGGDVMTAVRRALETIAERRGVLQNGAGGAIGRARLELSRRRWHEAAPAIEELLRAALSEGKEEEVLGAARLLLAADPRSRAALDVLVDRTRDPLLIVPRLHFLSRLAAASPPLGARTVDVEAVRNALLGTGG